MVPHREQNELPSRVPCPLIEHSNVFAGIPELPGITRNWEELGDPREATLYGLHNYELYTKMSM